MLRFSLAAEALTGLIYDRPSGENFSFVVSLLFPELSWRLLFNAPNASDSGLVVNVLAFKSEGFRFESPHGIHFLQ